MTRLFVLLFSRPSFFFNAPTTTKIYTLSLHDALPICVFGPKPSSGLYSNGVQEQIAWNNVRPTPADRKSTRLNLISYAVFCLKKKTLRKTTQRTLVRWCSTAC